MASQKSPHNQIFSAIPDTQWLSRFRRSLRRWYDRFARDLPWRRTADPYAIWISETMLQQTQVATVIPYFRRFLDRYPTVNDLAAADESEVLRLWEGLGYYRRARQMRKAAKIIAGQYAGRLPRDFDAIVALPGIGRYTAGAIASIAFDLRTPILEANTIRLHARLLGYSGDPQSSDGQRLLWEMAERVLPRSQVGRFNQALMELGGQICSGNNPDCDSCPANQLCIAKLSGRVDEIPIRKKKPTPIACVEAAILLRKSTDGAGRSRRVDESETPDMPVLLMRYGPNARRWAGLWDFPRLQLEENATDPDSLDPMLLHRPVIETLNERFGIEATSLAYRKTIRHSVTKYRIWLFCFEATMIGESHPTKENLPPDIAEFGWFTAQQLKDLPLSSPGRKVAGLV